MKKKEISELRLKEVAELKKLADKKANEIAMARLEIKAAKKKNVKSAWILRRDLAQIKTLIREKELA